MQASLIGSLLRTKKGMALKGFHSILRVVIHKSVFVPDSLTHPAETKKVPKDCHVYTWYPLTLLTILNNVCPGSPVGSRNLERKMNETRVFADGYRGVFQKQEECLIPHLIDI